MIVEMLPFLIFEILTFTIFCVAFFSKHEIMWGLALFLSGFMAFASYNISYNGVISSYPYMLIINMLLFLIGTIMLIFDLFDKYGSRNAKIPDQPPKVI